MPTLTELIDRKLKRLHNAPDNFISVVDKKQKAVLSALLDELQFLQIEEGAILVNDFNINRIGTIINGLQEIFFDAEYQAALTEFVSQINLQAETTRELIAASLGDIPTGQTLFTNLVRESQKNAVTLFGEAAINQEYFAPIQQLLSQNIVTGASLKETTKALRLITVNNPEGDGFAYRYAKTWSRTSFAQADAEYTTTLSRALGAEWYKYAGSVIETSRPFCETRHNKYYHVKEVEEWGTLGNWGGKIKGTNSSSIFANRGGWNCRHSLVPYSALRVPKEDLLRAMRKGYYKPDADEKATLGL
jgi:hypothetical protein